MNYFFDTEFYENGETIVPISLGIVADDGRELYMEVANAYEVASRSDWLIQNVRPHLSVVPQKLNPSPLESVCHSSNKSTHTVFQTRAGARIPLLDFIGEDASPVFWAYYASYDWVFFAQLFGRMIDLPEHFPKHPMDLQQLWVSRGRRQKEKPPKPANVHDALADAKWNQEFHANMTLGLPGEY